MLALWSRTLSSKVNLPHTINFRVLWWKSGDEVFQNMRLRNLRSPPCENINSAWNDSELPVWNDSKLGVNDFCAASCVGKWRTSGKDGDHWVLLHEKNTHDSNGTRDAGDCQTDELGEKKS